MKLHYILSVISCAIPFLGYAAPITPQKALEIANNTDASGVLRAPSSNAAFSIVNSFPAEAANTTACYVMARPSSDGYLLVAGDDILGVDVLGYSETGRYEEIPPAMIEWIKIAGKAIDYLYTHPDAKPMAIKMAEGKSVAPILGDIHWGQQPYYNRKAPSSSYPIGCVATAVGQVMYSQCWPPQGIGSHSYTSTTHKLKISQDFSKSTYQWDKMAPTLDSSSSTEAIDAVASMLYDFAVAVEMDFQTGGSGAYSEKIAGALANHFGYSKQVHIVKRDAVTGAEWLRLLHEELDNGFAVVYGGATSGMGMGHSFVCDGYNEDGLYHINWGWNGNGNGYFALNALAYDYIDMTTGQSMKDGFNYHQDMVVGIRPDRDGSTQWRDYEMFCEELSAVDNNGQPVAFTAITKPLGSVIPIYLYEAYNISNRMTPVAEMGLRLVDSNGTTITSPGTQYAGNYRFGPVLDDPVDVAIPADLADGSYTIEPYYIIEGENDARLFTTSVGAVNAINVDVAHGMATFTPKGSYDLQVNSLSWNTENLNSDESVTFTLNVTNHGMTYDGCLYFCLKVKGDKVAYHWFYSPHVDVTIEAGETAEIQFTQKLDCYRSDEYEITFYNRDELPFYTQYPLSIDGREPEPELSLTKRIKFIPKDYQVPYNCMILEAEVQNNGGLYEGKMFWVMVDPYTMMTNDCYEGRDHKVVIPGNGTTKTIHVMGTFDYMNSWSMSNEFIAVFNHVASNCYQAGSIGPAQYNLLETTYGSRNNSVTWDPQWDVENESYGEESMISFASAEKADIAISCKDGIVTAHLPSGASLKAMTIFDPSGRTVAFGNVVNKTNIATADITMLPSGTYFVAVSTTEGSTAAAIMR